MSAERIQIRLLERREWRKGLVSLRFEKPRDFTFKPGQFVRLGITTADGQYSARAYSMVSLPEDNFLEFFIVEVQGATVSPLLVSLKAGSSVWLEPDLFGSMLPERLPAGESLWCLSSGTGLAPFLSILREESTWLKWRKTVLVHSVRCSEDLAYTQLIEKIRTDSSLAGANERELIYIPIVTREATQFLSQRIPKLIVGGELEDAAALKLDPQNARVLLCGNPDMIKETRAILKDKGFKAPRRTEPGSLLAENLWND